MALTCPKTSSFDCTAEAFLTNFSCVQPPPNAPPPPPGKPFVPYIPPSLVPITAFKTGRKDCAGAPKGQETSGFPDGLKGQTETFAFFTKL